jgi:hypothetical protein
MVICVLPTSRLAVGMYALPQQFEFLRPQSRKTQHAENAELANTVAVLGSVSTLWICNESIAGVLDHFHESSAEFGRTFVIPLSIRQYILVELVVVPYASIAPFFHQ